MKNLYLQLGLDQNASPNEIEAALQAKPDLGESAAILLNESRRAAYNRTVSTLSSIGLLRHRLGLDTERSWFVATCPDFVPRLATQKQTPPSGSQAEAAETAASARNAEMTAPGSRDNGRWVRIAVILFAAVVLLTLGWAFSR